jgi:hypothetical protein
VSQATIERLYAGLAALDGQAMAACYAEDAHFEDEAFTLNGRREIGGMWRMLCDGARTKGKAHWKIETSQITNNSAHWDAHYLFSATNRLVLNRIDATFEFNPAGLIVKQRDRFDFWRWSRQALGAPGYLLGWSGAFQNKVRAKAMGNLTAFLAKNG